MKDGPTVALHHEQHGGNGPWLTLIHGGLVASPAFDRQVRDLSPNLTDVARVLTLDLRGYGDSPEAPEGGGYGVADLAADVSRLWDELGIDRSVVVGFSMGGFVAQQLALEAPERVIALVLVSTAAKLPRPAASAFEERAGQIEVGGLARECDTHVDKALSPAFREAQPELLAAYTELVASNRPQVVAATFRALGSFDRRGDLNRLEHPTLVVCGELDEGLGPEVAADLADAIPDAELLVLPGVGHTVQLENPNSFNRQVIDFLGRHAVIG